MDRKDFIKNALIGVTVATVGSPKFRSVKVKHSDYDKMMANVGFNHLPAEEGVFNENKDGMKTVLHQSNTRGHANHGWLNAKHTFSFANYYNPQRMNFGVLRVLNDDAIAGGRGFGMHPHDNMEIITIPLEGDLEHKDSMGNSEVIRSGDVQVMSAGTGVFHSEYNKNSDKPVKLLQIWLFPNKRNVKPRYDQITLTNATVENQLSQILSPNPNDEGVWIYQNAWFHWGNLTEGFSTNYTVKAKNNGVYVFVVEGKVTVAGQTLEMRDGLGIWDTDSFSLIAESKAKVLLMDVPMT
jgi:redox-sensitive bicupin YhaK (pirin superfamily)